MQLRFYFLLLFIVWPKKHRSLPLKAVIPRTQNLVMPKLSIGKLKCLLFIYAKYFTSTHGVQESMVQENKKHQQFKKKKEKEERTY